VVCMLVETLSVALPLLLPQNTAPGSPPPQLHLSPSELALFRRMVEHSPGAKQGKGGE